MLEYRVFRKMYMYVQLKISIFFLIFLFFFISSYCSTSRHRIFHPPFCSSLFHNIGTKNSATLFSPIPFYYFLFIWRMRLFCFFLSFLHLFHLFPTFFPFLYAPIIKFYPFRLPMFAARRIGNTLRLKYITDVNEKNVLG